ncbi:PREDICTED: transforming growth factor beta regulator 1 [Nicrophorus vespilloides]|uniref:Transforming growth factor beta regulator 1 n=1 Tax=Nicrophorus vespilloides TaxID=110193 RepID=A0ABM1MXF0_NICVS|nr:PREDICTED: transforming growth factor beta regulator 1 [Nicrophorus vespilloides]
MNNIKGNSTSSKYMKKLHKIKQLIREYVHENASLCDEINEVQETIIIRSEERKYLLKKLCLYEPQVEVEVETLSKSLYNSTAGSPVDGNKKTKKKFNMNGKESRKFPIATKSRKSNYKQRKKMVQPIPLDSNGRPIFPIELGSLTIHSLGEIVADRKEFHCEDAIYPVGYVSTKIYGSLQDPTIKCIYTCKISDLNGLPRFEIASDDNSEPIVGGTPDVCHSMLLQKINDILSLNVVTTRPRGHDFFGLTHPIVLNLIQCSPGSRKCAHYKWSKFEVSKNSEQFVEDNDTSLSFKMLQRSIDYCKYKMGPA